LGPAQVWAEIFSSALHPQFRSHNGDFVNIQKSRKKRAVSVRFSSASSKGNGSGHGGPQVAKSSRRSLAPTGFGVNRRRRSETKVRKRMAFASRFLALTSFWARRRSQQLLAKQRYSPAIFAANNWSDSIPPAIDTKKKLAKAFGRLPSQKVDTA